MRLTNNYKSQTPFTVELVSDILLIISQSVTGYAMLEGNITLGWISLITGVISKILARFVESNENRLENSPSTDACGCGSDGCACKQ